jgi:hypothetical protein
METATMKNSGRAGLVVTLLLAALPAAAGDGKGVAEPGARTEFRVLAEAPVAIR